QAAAPLQLAHQRDVRKQRADRVDAFGRRDEDHGGVTAQVDDEMARAPRPSAELVSAGSLHGKLELTAQLRVHAERRLSAGDIHPERGQSALRRYGQKSVRLD